MNLQTRYDLERTADALADRLEREVEPYAAWVEVAGTAGGERSTSGRGCA